MSEKESKNAPSFDYSGAIKQPIRKSAKKWFRRKPYSLSWNDDRTYDVEEEDRHGD